MLRLWQMIIRLDVNNKEVPLYQALATEVERLIETGALHEGDALPGSRELAQHLGISRKTVVTAMSLLVRNGWLENRARVGLFVMQGKGQQSSMTTTSQDTFTSCCKPKLVISGGGPDMRSIPYGSISRSYRLFFNLAAKHGQLGYHDPRGVLKFRQYIAQSMRHVRCLTIGNDEVIVTRGTQQALYLAAHALLKPGDAVVMEWPTYDNAVQVLQSAHLEILYVDVDRDGLRVDDLAELIVQHPNVRAVYVTPRHQFPTTVTLSAARRDKLASLVTEHDLLVLEDDFDSFVQYVPQLPLCAMLPKRNYVYVATASKLLAPSLRVGYAASDLANIEAMAAYRRIIDVQGDMVMERALAALVEAGEVRRHIKHSWTLYKERLDYISQKLCTELKGRVKYKRPTGGLSVWLEMNEDPRPLLNSKGIEAMVFELPAGKFGLRIGYASMHQESVDQLVAALKG